MSLPGICIRRPAGTMLLTLALVLAGIIAFRLLPVAPLPQVDFPTISVQAQLPGAEPITMTRKYQGTGLGLAIVKRQVELMAGTVCLDCDRDCGTRVVCEIPLELPDRTEAALRNVKVGTTTGPRLRLLVVEDDPVSGVTATRLLSKLGHASVGVESGQEALDLLARERFDAILMMRACRSSTIRNRRRWRSKPPWAR